jgi:hypothetical protein
MEIDRTITNVWKVTIVENEVFNRFIDETIQESKRRSLGNAPSLVASDDDRAILHRYYRDALAELSAVLARRTTRVGGSIINTTDETTKMLTTVFTLPMTDNHESELLSPLASHCLEFLIAKLMEKWFGHGSDFGSEGEKDEIRHILHFRRVPIERPFRPL